MKRIAIGIIIILAMILVGCNTVEQPGQSNNSSNNTKTYNDETHKKIQFGKLSFDIEIYHIVSKTNSDDIETIVCEIDKGRGYSWTKPQITFTIREIKKQDVLNKESIIAYIRDVSPNYERIKVYNNITDDSGITKLLVIMEGDLTKYIVYYEDACYFIESDVDEVYLLKNYPLKYYVVHNQNIKCANSFVANVNETVFYHEYEFEKSEYDILQGKSGKKYFGELNRDKEQQYHFTLKDEAGENLLTLSTYGEFYDIIQFLDVNMDGYVDIQFLEEPGAMNNSYVLYVWDDSAKNFVKVKCDEMLSHFEVHEGYLLNWGKNDADSGVIQKLVWDKNTLVKESEKPYRAD